MPVSRHLSIWSIIVVAVILFAAEQIDDNSFAESGGTIPTQVRAAASALVEGKLSRDNAKALSTLVTSMFLHADVEHILYNMVFLWTFGVLASELLGQWRALATFVACGIGGAIVHTCLNPDSSVPMVGASGAISGLEGLYLGLAVRWQLPNAEVWPLAYPVPPLQLGAFAIVGFVGDLLLSANHDQHIAYGAHLGGFLAGLAIAAVTTTVYPTLHAYERAGRKNRSS
jgi:membrane associated rhomboid family serine protease